VTLVVNASESHLGLSCACGGQGLSWWTPEPDPRSYNCTASHPTSSGGILMERINARRVGVVFCLLVATTVFATSG